MNELAKEAKRASGKFWRVRRMRSIRVRAGDDNLPYYKLCLQHGNTTHMGVTFYYDGEIAQTRADEKNRKLIAEAEVLA